MADSTDPVSAEYEANIKGLEGGLAALPGIYNPQRQRLATEAGRGFEESGLYDTANVQANPADASGNITWVVFRGPQGRLYRQAFTSVAAGANQAGGLFSSTAERGARQAQQGLDIQGDQGIRSFETGQTGLTTKQLDETRSKTDDLESARGKYADWKAAQKTAADTVPTPPAPPAAPDGTPTPPAAPTTPPIPPIPTYKPPKPVPVAKSVMGPYGPTGIPIKGYAQPIKKPPTKPKTVKR